MITAPNYDAKRIKTDMDRIWYSAGIPQQYWGPMAGTPAFKAFRISDTETDPMIMPTDQVSWFNKLVVNDHGILLQPHLVYMCAPNSHVGMSLAFHVAKRCLMLGSRIQVDNASDWSKLISPEPMNLLLNVSADSTKDRVCSVVDWVHTYRSTFRMVVFSGTPRDAVDLLRERPTLAFHAHDIVTQVQR